MFNFTIVHSAENNKTLAVIVKSPKEIAYVVRSEAEQPLEVLLTRGRIVVEEKLNPQTIIKRTVERKDEDYLKQVSYKLTPPLIASVFGNVEGIFARDVVKDLWSRFADGEVPEMKTLSL